MSGKVELLKRAPLILHSYNILGLMMAKLTQQNQKYHFFHCLLSKTQHKSQIRLYYASCYSKAVWRSRLQRSFFFQTCRLWLKSHQLKHFIRLDASPSRATELFETSCVYSGELGKTQLTSFPALTPRFHTVLFPVHNYDCTPLMFIARTRISSPRYKRRSLFSVTISAASIF